MLRPYVRPHQGPEGTYSIPLASNSNDRKQRSMRKSVKIITVLVAITFMSSDFVFDPTLRMLSTARKLCQTYFIGDLDGDSPYWEEEYPADVDYPGEPRVLPGGENNIGFVVTLDSCPDDNSYKAGVDTQYDPGHALYDAAAVLKHSIETNLAKTGKYNATMHAIVHPSAITCLTPNGDSYDRVKVLENLGYYVNIQASPLVNPLEITDPVVQQNLDADAGDRDLTKLQATKYDTHPAVGTSFFSLHPECYVFSVC
jgi:hypothetical protein